MLNARSITDILLKLWWKKQSFFVCCQQYAYDHPLRIKHFQCKDSVTTTNFWQNFANKKIPLSTVNSVVICEAQLTQKSQKSNQAANLWPIWICCEICKGKLFAFTRNRQSHGFLLKWQRYMWLYLNTTLKNKHTNTLAICQGTAAVNEAKISASHLSHSMHFSHMRSLRN